MRFQNVIFDLDSTLTDTLATIAETRGELVRRLARASGVDEEKLLGESRVLLRADFHDPNLIDRLPSLAPWRRHSAAYAEAERAAYLEHLARAASLLPDTETVLEALSELGIRSIVWSNKRSSFARLHLSQLDLRPGWFEALYCVRDAAPRAEPLAALPGIHVIELEREQRKPNPQTTLRILEENGFAPEDTVLVGNNVKNDGGATLGTGVAFVLVDWGIPSEETQAAIWALTGSERLAYGTGGRLRPEYERYVREVRVHTMLRRSLVELLDVLGVDEAPNVLRAAARRRRALSP